ncbi:triacylglycerol lipase [Corynebacterium terpenotabidum Y-11]|uniref:Triacylglycerol lipase n=1 Tax=Corynebacterium terpenotabidum Y-11 TaxID=1200352 RepID=S4X9B2_9CORY|nr:triacylglycerol lipase [Corynebacterium terpenotabidum Y-11]
MLAAAGLVIAAPHAVAAPDAPLGSVGIAGPAYPATPAPQDSTTGNGPGASDFIDAFVQSFANPRLAPVGADDWNCQPTAEHPTPVVLIHGTWENAYDNWSAMAPELKAEGYCVFTPNYGAADLLTKGGAGEVLPNTFGTKDIAESAGEIATYVDAVLAATGADKVDLVGHSQGGLLARQYLKFNGGAAKVDKVVTLGATNHGTTLSGIGNLDRFIGDLGLNLDPLLDYVVGESGMQQVYDSPLQTSLNAGGDTLPGITYTVIGTQYDEVTTPYDSTFLTAGEGATVTNITLQDGCAADHSDHVSMTYSPRLIDLVKNALAPGTVAEPRCTANSPIMGAGSEVPLAEGLTPALGWLAQNTQPWVAPWK